MKFFDAEKGIELILPLNGTMPVKTIFLDMLNKFKNQSQDSH